MANKYYDGSEKKNDSEKTVKPGKSIGKKIVDGAGALLGLVVLIGGAFLGLKKE